MSIVNQLVSNLITILSGILSNYLPMTLVFPISMFIQTVILGFFNSNYYKRMLNIFSTERNITITDQFVIVRQSDNKSFDNIMYNKLGNYLTNKYKNKMHSLDVFVINDDVKFHETLPMVKNIYYDTLNDIKYTISHEPEEIKCPNNDKKYFRYVITCSTKNFDDIKKYMKYVYSQKVKKLTSDIYQISTENHISKWYITNHKINRTFKNTFLTQAVYNNLIKDIRHFIESKDIYDNLGLLHKRGYILYGPPGTGKTSVIKAIANSFFLPIFKLDLSNIFNNTSLNTLMESINKYQTGKPHLVCIEDFERSDIFKTLTDNNSTGQTQNIRNRITPAGILNAIDGVVENHGQILIDQDVLIVRLKFPMSTTTSSIRL